MIRNSIACNHAAVAALMVALLTTATANADFVMPRSLAAAEGSTSTFLGGLFGEDDLTYQFQIAGSELTAQGLQVGDQITGVRQRQEGGFATEPAIAVTVPDLELTLAQATNSIAGMSTAFASNMTNAVLVHDGAYTLPANSMPGGNTPNAFGALVPFDSPYTYQGGDLIFMYTKPFTVTTVITDHAGPSSFTGAGTLYRSLFANGFQATTGALGTESSIIQFQVASVPEARAWLMLGIVTAGLLSVGVIRGRLVFARSAD